MATAVVLGGAAMAAAVAGRSGFGKIFTKSSLRLHSVGQQQLWWYLALVSVFAVLGQEFARSSALATALTPGSTEFDGFGDELDDPEFDSDAPVLVPPHVVRRPGFENDHGPPPVEPTVDPVADVKVDVKVDEPNNNVEKPRRRQELWDEDEFEGLPEEDDISEEAPKPKPAAAAAAAARKVAPPSGPQNYYMEIFSVVFLVAYAVKYFLGRKENEKIALSWATEYAAKGNIFEKNFSLLGIGEGEDAALLMKEGQNVFKFYASGRRCCQGLLATLELKNRHDLISCLWYYVMPKRDEVTIDVYMNEESMDSVVMAVARRKNAKVMNKDWTDLQQFAAGLNTPSQRKWVSEDLSVISEFREVASDLLSDAVLDLVLGEKAFKEYGSNFISLHFSDAYPLGVHRKLLQFRFYLPAANRMGEVVRLIQMVVYFIDAVGRYKLSAQARAKAESARQKLQQEAFKQAQNARQEALARKKEEKRKASEEIESKLTPEALRKKEEKDRAKQLKKSMPRMKISRH